MVAQVATGPRPARLRVRVEFGGQEGQREPQAKEPSGGDQRVTGQNKSQGRRKREEIAGVKIQLTAAKLEV